MGISFEQMQPFAAQPFVEEGAAQQWSQDLPEMLRQQQMAQSAYEYETSRMPSARDEWQAQQQAQQHKQEIELRTKMQGELMEMEMSQGEKLRLQRQQQQVAAVLADENLPLDVKNELVTELKTGINMGQRRLVASQEKENEAQMKRLQKQMEVEERMNTAKMNNMKRQVEFVEGPKPGDAPLGFFYPDGLGGMKFHEIKPLTAPKPVAAPKAPTVKPMDERVAHEKAEKLATEYMERTSSRGGLPLSDWPEDIKVYLRDYYLWKQRVMDAVTNGRPLPEMIHGPGIGGEDKDAWYTGMAKEWDRKHAAKATGTPVAGTPSTGTPVASVPMPGIPGEPAPAGSTPGFGLFDRAREVMRPTAERRTAPPVGAIASMPEMPDAAGGRGMGMPEAAAVPSVPASERTVSGGKPGGDTGDVRSGGMPGEMRPGGTDGSGARSDAVRKDYLDLLKRYDNPFPIKSDEDVRRAEELRAHLRRVYAPPAGYGGSDPEANFRNWIREQAGIGGEGKAKKGDLVRTPAMPGSSAVEPTPGAMRTGGMDAGAGKGMAGEPSAAVEPKPVARKSFTMATADEKQKAAMQSFEALGRSIRPDLPNYRELHNHLRQMQELFKSAGSYGAMTEDEKSAYRAHRKALEEALSKGK